MPRSMFHITKKQIAEAAHEVTIPLLEDDSKVTYTVSRNVNNYLDPRYQTRNIYY